MTVIDVEAAAPAALVGRFEALGLLPGEGCDAEVGLEAQAWIERTARSLRHGYLMTLDYGYDAAALYAPWAPARHAPDLLPPYVGRGRL